MMTFYQFLCALRNYRADVLILGLGVTLVCALLKKTVLRRYSGKLYFFLPFAVGLVLYAVYRMIAALSVSPLTEAALETLEGGLGCGSAATVYYIVYEQFLRRGKTAFSLAPALAPLMPEEKREAVSAQILALDTALGEEEYCAKIADILRENAEPALAEAELLAAARLIGGLLRPQKT